MNENYKKYLCSLLNWSEAEFDKIYASQSYRGIRINELKANKEKVLKSFDTPLVKTPFFKNSYYIPANLQGVGNMPFHHSGAFYVQEPSASSVLTVVDAKPNEKILDLCAAPGGKTTGIAEGICGTGLIWANEYVRKRAQVLLSNTERMGITNCVVSSLDAEYLCSSLENFFDKVLVDAPCSGEGMWRHNPQVEEQWSKDYVLSVALMQREILNSAAKAVKGGGRLIYSTCTFSPEENENRVAEFLKQNPDFELEKIDVEFGMGGLGGDDNIDKKVRRIIPNQGGEGHFVASFLKKDAYTFNSFETVTEDIKENDKKIVLEFINLNFNDFNLGVLIKKGEFVYSVPPQTPMVKGDVLRYGLLIGEIRKNRLEPAHALFAAAGTTPKRVLDLSLDDERLYKFLHGEEITADTVDNGYISVRVEGCPLSFGKQSGNRITNKYPKGLRIL